ncbi:restriction endonuclease subunit S [Vibrio alginolyticus]|nr:restriction endonuclease subunit S [Vibrio alginolyticus]
MTTLGEYIKVQGGYAYKSKDFIEFSKNKVLKIKNVRFGTIDYAEPAYVSDEIAESTKNWKVKEGDVLISMTGSGPNAPQSLVGRVARVWKNEPDAWINQRVGRICLLDEDSVHLDFIFYWLSLPQSQDYLVSNSSGSANQANISGKTIESLPCPKVDYQTSKQIADLARKFDEKVILNSKTNQTLEEMAQAIFKSWFVDFDPVKAKMNGEQPEGMDEATASLFPEKLVESELGLIPEGWEPKQLKDILELAYGKALKKTDRVEGDVPVYGSGGLTGYHNQSLVEGPGIIVGRKGTVGSVYWEPKSFYPIDTVFYVKPKAGYSLKYCHLVLQNLGLKNMNTDAAVPGLNRNNAYRLDVIIPNEAVLDKFNIIMQSFQLLIDANNAQNTNLSLLRDTLLPELLSGKIFNTVTKEG